MHADTMLRAIRERRADFSVPANDSKAVAFKAISVDEEGVIIGIGSSDAWDSQGESMTAKAVVQIAYEFCSKAEREFRINHDAEAIIGCDLVASFPGAPILVDGVVVGIDIRANATHWFVGVRPHDSSLVEEAKAGKIVGFSWGGYASKVEHAP